MGAVNVVRSRPDEEHGRKKISRSFLDYYLPILGVLQYYATGSTGSYGSLVLYAYAAILLVLNIGRKPLYFHKGLVCFVLYAIITQPIVYSLYGGFSSGRFFNYFSVIYILLVLSVMSNKLNGEVFFKNYLYVGAVCSLVIVFQSVQLYILGQKVSGIALLPCDTTNWYAGGDRPCGLFPEPSSYAYFMLPLLVMCLARSKRIAACLITVCIAMSTSSLGVIGTLIVWACYIAKQYDVRYMVVSVIAVFIVIWGILQTPMGQYAITKILNTDFVNNPRLTRGFLIFANLDPWQQAFGIGRNNLDYFISHGLVQLTDYTSTMVSEKNIAYVTSVSAVLINYGIVGFAIYFTPFMLMFVRLKNIRLLIGLFLLLSFVQTMFFDMNFAFLLLIIFNQCDLSQDFWKLGQAGRFKMTSGMPEGK